MDSMDGWRDILHFDFHGEHVLFSSLRIDSGFNFIVASLLTVFLCLLEKYLTYVLSSKSNPLPSRHSRLGNAIFRASIYWVVTLLRLLYMLLAMSFHVGLIVVVVTTLTAGQFAIDYYMEAPPDLKRRRNLASSAEYHDNPDGTTDRLLTASGYPPRGKPDTRLGVRDNGTTAFVIEDGEETA